ncbi:hypothetical protein ACH4S8_44840 [Streptomyces sp. NPDC021080]|uniref:hypothetical protein n=1 Tax=Streptomyces sp. NPDC021080 TaxID=3365110 RepID=UPI0037B7D362
MSELSVVPAREDIQASGVDLHALAQQRHRHRRVERLREIGPPAKDARRSIRGPLEP